MSRSCETHVEQAPLEWFEKPEWTVFCASDIATGEHQ